jgi:hypothetical protein
MPWVRARGIRAGRHVTLGPAAGTQVERVREPCVPVPAPNRRSGETVSESIEQDEDCGIDEGVDVLDPVGAKVEDLQERGPQ